MDWFLYDNDPHHERVMKMGIQAKENSGEIIILIGIRSLEIWEWNVK